MKIYCWLQVICCLHCFINNLLDIRRQCNLTDLAFPGIISSQIAQSYQDWEKDTAGLKTQGRKKKRGPFNLYWHFLTLLSL